jgi:long-chain acyl-CoA synthetase
MNFWNFNSKSGEAIFDGNNKLSFQELQKYIISFAKNFPLYKSLGFILCENRIDDVVAYLSSVYHGHVCLLLSNKISKLHLENLQKIYQPNWISDGKNFNLLNTEKLEINNDLAILLSTSGTTGSQKLVRLSYQNLQSNADSIIQYLKIEDKQKPIAHLPIHYSYGLSVLNSHFNVGAGIIITNNSLMEPNFWNLCGQATSISGVPYTYEMLHRLRLENKISKNIKTFTQAGGRLSDHLTKYFCDFAKKTDRDFFVMYGQTEATARISYVPSKELENFIGYIGIVIPDGHMELDPDNQEIIYKGKNVMMGYAESLQDLALGDLMEGVLRTGDLGEKDSNGFFKIIGRLKRFIKIFGNRLNLDEMENQLSSFFGKQILFSGKDDSLTCIIDQDLKPNLVLDFMKKNYPIHPSAISIKILDFKKLPLLASGKIDYARL